MCIVVLVVMSVQVIKPDFSNFDENSAWPYLLDEFVDYAKEQK